MLGSLYSGITGMDAAAAEMNVIANNIANVNTTAFKAGTISFASVYAESVSMLGSSPGNEDGKGVQVVGLGSVWQQGAIESTMNPTDVSITGDGFFKVVENGVSDYYTRAGQFNYDENYNMVDPEGRVVQGFNCDLATGIADTTSNVDITIPPGYTEVNLETGGLITAENAAGTREYLFQIAVYDFPNVDGLKKMTGNLYQQSYDSGAPLYANGNVSGVNGAGKLNNNNLEMSNVDLARQFVDLIISQRSFQANSRVISSSADMLQEVINIIR
ncbi:MAG: flagellar hook basal-body protein [Deltaproteobacteria bacterium]|nr:flagellar hook basal-body protein [Deltaproteobacteria bacterium]